MVDLYKPMVGIVSNTNTVQCTVYSIALYTEIAGMDWT